MKTIKPLKNETKIEKAVRRWVNTRVEIGYEVEDVLKDLLQGGCQSGFVGSLIYLNQTGFFFEQHRDEINALLKDQLADMGAKSPSDLFGDKWDDEDPLALGYFNQNLLAWFGFEETARKIAHRVGIEI